MDTPVSLYLHLPFCLHKCSYCDLNAYAGLNDLIPAYVDALTDEIKLIGSGANFPIHTIYFGGGTPSVTPIRLIAQLVEAIQASFHITSDVEVSFEANPETLDMAYLAGLRGLGINRLSIGAQSAQANELALFQRTHTWQDVEKATRLSRQSGFNNISLDLIYGLPGQTMAAWQDTFQRALALAPDHFSVYALSIDFNTPMRAWVQRGLLPEQDDDLVADMYEWSSDALDAAGYQQYELSSWAKRPMTTIQCRHNLQYWHNQPYLGLGAGAHGYFGGIRYSNFSNPAAYVSRMKDGQVKPFPLSPAAQDTLQIERGTEMNETLLTGLRLVQDGISVRSFESRFGQTPRQVFGRELADLEARRLIEFCGDRILLTREGRFVSNWVFEKFV